MKKSNLKNIKKKDELILSIALIVFLGIFISIWISISSEGNLLEFDKKINLEIEKVQTPFFISLSKIITNIFDPIVFIFLSLAIVLYLIYKKRNLEAYLFVIILALGNFFVNLIKLIVQRERPANILFSEITYSFPSSHATIAVLFFGVLVYLFEHHMTLRKSKISLIISAFFVAIIIALTRIYLNSHWFLDVVAGLSFGAFLLTAYILILSKADIFKTH